MGIVLGHKGRDDQGDFHPRRAGRDFRNFWAAPVHLFLQVKVRENWMEENPSRVIQNGGWSSATATHDRCAAGHRYLGLRPICTGLQLAGIPAYVITKGDTTDGRG